MDDGLITVAVILVIVGGLFAWGRLRRDGSQSTVELNYRAESASNPIWKVLGPKWKPVMSIDIPRTIQTFARYTDHKRTFAVFTHGTCVLLPDGTEDAESDAKEILDKIYRQNPDFNPLAMDDGHVLVSYSQLAYSVVFKDEFEAHREYIDDNHLDGVIQDEVLISSKPRELKTNEFDERGKSGLLGRALMFLDAETPVVLQIWRPSFSLHRQKEQIQEELGSHYDQIAGTNARMAAPLAVAKQAAASNVTVLLLGGDGAEKELVARAIQQWSPRRSKPFVAVNCASIRKDLLENELFGYEKGAFPGAVKREAGKIEIAEGGTVFLDEIGDIPPSLQSRLWRLLVDATFLRVGGTQAVDARVRLIVGTHGDLPRAVDEGTFPGNLYWRLSAITIALPPLGDR
jgi:transcriptional regulator with PAS, ATPase and Fis domain